MKIRSVLVVACVLLTGCATNSADTSSSKLFVYNWTDYLDQSELTRFTQETGINVVLDVYDSNETLLAKLQAGGNGYDVIFPSDYMVPQLQSLGLLKELNTSELSNAKNIKPEFFDVPWDRERKYTAPYMYGSTGIACNPIDPECLQIRSWRDYFTTTSTGVSSIKDQNDVVSAALRAVGVTAENLCTTDKEPYQKALELLQNFHPAVIDSDGSTERMLNGNTTIQQTWNGEVFRMRPDIPDLIYIYPTEGLNLWADNIAIPEGANHVDNAKIFINWLLDPKNVAAQSNYTGYDNAIIGAYEFMDPKVKDDPAIVPPAEFASLLSPTPRCGPDALELYTQVFTTWTTNQ